MGSFFLLSCPKYAADEFRQIPLNAPGLARARLQYFVRAKKSNFQKIVGNTG